MVYTVINYNVIPSLSITKVVVVPQVDSKRAASPFLITGLSSTEIIRSPMFSLPLSIAGPSTSMLVIELLSPIIKPNFPSLRGPRRTVNCLGVPIGCIRR